MAGDCTTADEQARQLVPLSPFGPAFFVGQLRAFARDRCPDPAESLPIVEIHLATGDVLDLCHVMGLAPAFVALAVREGPGHGARDARMRTELVPYTLITRVTIRPVEAGAAHVGFDLHRAPEVLASGASAEETLRAAASVGLEGEGGGPEETRASPGRSGESCLVSR